jgi:beta-N-acetylhexosaminidase
MTRDAAATLFPGFEGTEAPGWVLRLVEQGLGGVVLFARNVPGLPELAAQLHEAGPVLVALDEEGGDVTRLEAATGSSYPGNAALGVVDEPSVTRAVAAALGADLRAAGVDLDLAPVADVNSDPLNPVIGVRSFGADAERVSVHLGAFVEGLQAQGVAACAKHYPGHGATRQDSHVELPTVSGDPDAGLPPFDAAIAADVQSVMTAHVLVPSVDRVPATLSPRILGRLRAHYDGMVITDALEMGAIRDIEEGAVRALLAGADALCLGHDLPPDDVHGAIVAAVRSGRLAEERLAGAASRVSTLASSLPAAPVDGEVPRIVGLEAARRAVRAEGDLRLSREALVVELLPEPSIAAGPADHGLAAALGAETVSLGPDDPAVTDERRLVVVVQDAHRHPWQQSAAEAILDAARDAILVELGVPLWRPHGVPYLATYGRGRVNLEAAAEVLQDH